MIKEIYPGIFFSTEKTIFKLTKPAVNIYMIPGKDGILFDAGYGNKKHVKKLIADIRELKSRDKAYGFSRILISHTHPDHFAGLRAIRERLGVKICLTALMSRTIASRKGYLDTFFIGKDRESGIIDLFMRCIEKFYTYIWYKFYIMFYGLEFISDPDIIIETKTKISINGETWEIFPSPGHAEDHISLYNKKKGILLAGDNIFRSKSSWLGPPKSDLSVYIRSMKELLKLPKLEIILTAHGSSVINRKKGLTRSLNGVCRELRKCMASYKNMARAGFRSGRYSGRCIQEKDF